VKRARHEPADAPRPRAGAGSNGLKQQFYDPTLIVQLYTGGLSMPQVAARLGCHSNTVLRVLQAAGIGRRRHHNPPTPPPPALDTAQTEKVVHLYTRLGLEVWQIIRRTEHTALSVKRALRQAGIPIRQGKRGRAGWPDADIAHRYQRGDSIGTIAAGLGMSEHTVRNRLDAAGIPRRPRSRTPDDVRADFVHRYTQLHQPVGRIAKQTGRSRTAITRALIAAGHPPSSATAAPGRRPEDAEGSHIHETRTRRLR